MLGRAAKYSSYTLHIKLFTFVETRVAAALFLPPWAEWEQLCCQGLLAL